MLVSLLTLLTVASVSGNSLGYWCVKDDESVDNQVGTSFRGKFRNFSLFVEEKDAMLSNCTVIKSYVLGNDGLWVVEESSAKAVENTKGKLLARGFPIYFEKGLSFIVGGGAEVPSASGLDGCGADLDTAFMPVASRTVMHPKLSVQRLSEWHVPSLLLNPEIENAVSSVTEDSLTMTIEALQALNTRNSFSDTIYVATDYLVGRLEGMGFEVSVEMFESNMGPNIVASLPGEFSEWVVAGAHYDSRTVNVTSPTDLAPGADDNASGVAAMIELAAAIKNLTTIASRGVRICFFSGEEQGLFGSKALAEKWSNAGDNIVGMINADMLGYQATDTVTLGFKDTNVTPELVELAKALTAMYVPSLPTADTASCCSDYLAFYQAGFPAIGYFESPLNAEAYPAYHTSEDFIQYVNFAQLKLEAQSVLATVLTLLLSQAGA